MSDLRIVIDGDEGISTNAGTAQPDATTFARHR
jgi:hypothetical protein